MGSMDMIIRTSMRIRKDKAMGYIEELQHLHQDHQTEEIRLKDDRDTSHATSTAQVTVSQ